MLSLDSSSINNDFSIKKSPSPQLSRVPETLPNASPLCPDLLGVRGQGKNQTDHPASTELMERKPQMKGAAGAPSSHLPLKAATSDNRQQRDHRQENQVCGKWKSSLSCSLMMGKSTFFFNLDNKHNEKPSTWKEFS